MSRRSISGARTMVFYSGLLLLAAGILTLGSVFVALALHWHDPTRDIRIIAGLLLFITGRFVMQLGRRGLAGSGVVLDPERAREDLEPWSRMAGGMVKDALDESGIAPGKPGAAVEFADKLRQLHALREEGILTEEEYKREKAEILERN